MKFLDPHHPMFDRAWVRWVTVIFPAVWAGVELWIDSPGWAMVFAAASAYAGWQLFVVRQR
jgi:hypothetical protein